MLYPCSVRATDLSHGGEESLGVEEAGHPERVGSPIKAPRVELSVAVNQLREPETQRARVPGDLNHKQSVLHSKSFYLNTMKTIKASTEERLNDTDHNDLQFTPTS